MNNVLLSKKCECIRAEHVEQAIYNGNELNCGDGHLTIYPLSKVAVFDVNDGEFDQQVEECHYVVRKWAVIYDEYYRGHNGWKHHMWTYDTECSAVEAYMLFLRREDESIQNLRIQEVWV